MVELDSFANFLGTQDFTRLQSTMTQVGSNVVLALGNQTLTFANAVKTQFTAKDFALPLNLAGFQQTFDDEFNTFSASADGHTTTWQAISGTFASNKEAEYYSNKVGAGAPLASVMECWISPPAQRRFPPASPTHRARLIPHDHSRRLTDISK